MIQAGEIECRIPSNGIKPDHLFCTEPAALRLDIWTVTGSWVTALATIGLFVAAVWTARVAIGTLRQMKRDSEAQTRPYVYAQVVPSLAGIGSWDIIIKNVGQSAARNLTAQLSAWPKDDDIITNPLRTMFSTPQTLPPGAQLRAYWLMGPPEGATMRDPTTGGQVPPAGIKDPVTVTFSYHGDGGNGASYRDEFDVDTTRIGLTPVASSGPEPKKSMDLKDQEIYKILGYIVSQLGELRR